MKRPASDPTERPGWIPHPALSLVLAAVWLLLQQSLAPAHLLTAALLALGLPWLLHGFIGAAVRPRALGTVVHLFGVVLWDIVVSNIAVARLALNPRADPQPAWVPVALDVADPTAITLLATIITMTPGTVSCIVDEDERLILVHALDCADAAALAAQIKQRYEQPLSRIFEGVEP